MALSVEVVCQTKKDGAGGGEGEMEGHGKKFGESREEGRAEEKQPFASSWSAHPISPLGAGQFPDWHDPASAAHEGVRIPEDRRRRMTRRLSRETDRTHR